MQECILTVTLCGELQFKLQFKLSLWSSLQIDHLPLWFIVGGALYLFTFFFLPLHNARYFHRFFLFIIWQKADLLSKAEGVSTFFFPTDTDFFLKIKIQMVFVFNTHCL